MNAYFVPDKHALGAPRQSCSLLLDCRTRVHWLEEKRMKSLASMPLYEQTQQTREQLNERNRGINRLNRQLGSSPQLGGLIIAASCKIRRRWMKRDRENKTAVPLQRGDACRGTAICTHQPQLGGTVTAASRKIRRRWIEVIY